MSMPPPRSRRRCPIVPIERTGCPKTASSRSAWPLRGLRPPTSHVSLAQPKVARRERCPPTPIGLESQTNHPLNTLIEFGPNGTGSSAHHPKRAGHLSGFSSSGGLFTRPAVARLRSQGPDRVLHLAVVAPDMRSSNTGGATSSGCKASSAPVVDDGATPRWPDGPQDPGPWRKIDVILPRHDLRESDHQRRQRNTDNGLRGEALRAWPLSGRRTCPPSPGLERVLHRDDASVRASRLCRDLRQPLRARGWGSDGNPDDVAAKVRAEGASPTPEMVGDTEAAVKWIRRSPIITARLVSSAPALAAGMPLSTPANGRTLTPASNNGGAEWRWARRS